MSVQETPPSQVLLLTVGMGNAKDAENSLYVPLLQSIKAGSWTLVVLLPSQSTISHAEEIVRRCPTLAMEIRPLPVEGAEDNPDTCYDHFQKEISRLRDCGWLAAEIVADFTRGTKAMSAALVLAATRHDLTTLRYVGGERGGAQNLVQAGTECIVEVVPMIATAQKRLDMALRFAEHGNFAGTIALLPDEDTTRSWPPALRDAASALLPAFQFYSAWDRLDYRTAAAIEIPVEVPLPDWQPVWPTQPMRSWVGRLSATPERDNHAAMAARLRLLSCDLLANGERRIRDRHYEDAVLRAYRVLELIGQVRLFDRGLSSACLPPGHLAVQALKQKLEKKGSAGFGKNKDGTLTAGRELVARLLKQLGDDLAETLLNFDKQPGLPRISDRNYSVLIHGFQAVGTDDDRSLRALYRELEALLVRDAGDDAKTALLTARQADISIRPGSAS